MVCRLHHMMMMMMNSNLLVHRNLSRTLENARINIRVDTVIKGAAVPLGKPHLVEFLCSLTLSCSQDHGSVHTHSMRYLLQRQVGPSEHRIVSTLYEYPPVPAYHCQGSQALGQTSSPQRALATVRACDALKLRLHPLGYRSLAGARICELSYCTNPDTCCTKTRGILPNLQDVPSSAPGTTRVFWARTRTVPIK